MKKLFTLCVILCAGIFGLSAQTFSDNFDSYTANSFLVQSNPVWKTWTNKPGGVDDVRISNAKAKSGANSLYFSSTVSSGGPADIVLPFGGTELISGSFSLSMQMFVDSQKKGYFNLQEQTVLGQGWSIDVNFDSTGGFNIVNTTAGTLLTGTYTQNQWNKVSLQINLSTNTWEFFLNDISQGSFQNTYRKIASIDFFPTFNSSYYVDDVSYTITPFTLPAINASVTYIDKIQGKLAGQQIIPSVEIRNMGTGPVNSGNIDITYNGNTISQNFSGQNLLTNATYTVAFSSPLLLVGGTNNLTATLTQVNGGADSNAADNVKTITINPTVPAIGKAVVTEEATGTWCSWCPRGAVWLKRMEDQYDKYIIGIAVHNNDPMKNANYDGNMKNKVSSYPSVIVDRGLAKDPSAMEPDFLSRVMIAPKGSIKNGAEYNAVTRELKVSLTTKFNSSVSGNYKIAFVLTEDSVTGTDAGYNQANSYAGGSKGIMGGYEKLPNPVPAAQMVYDHVGRVIYPNFNGLSNAFAATVNANDSFTHNFSIILESGWRSNHVNIIGLLIDPSGKIDNGSSTTLSTAIGNGYVAGTTILGLNNLNKQANGILVYPNPSQNQFEIQLGDNNHETSSITVYALDGKRMFTQNTLHQNSIQIDAVNWPAGLYMLYFQNNKLTSQIKLIKE